MIQKSACQTTKKREKRNVLSCTSQSRCSTKMTLSASFLVLFLALLVEQCLCQSNNTSTTQPSCYNNLYQSDVNDDLKIDNDEYVTFVKLEGGNEDFLQNVTSFVELPIMLQSNFYTLACLCRTQTGEDSSTCCVGSNAHLNVNGTQPGVIPTDEQSQYLNLVCGLTTRAIDSYIATQPTPSPVTTAPPTTVPTTVPTQSPTIQPTPETTTPPPTMTNTTLAPTIAPTTLSPTLEPTIMTTTVSPTLSPISPDLPVMVVIRTSYTILIENGLIENIPHSSYESQLIAAMDIFSQQIATELNDMETTTSNGQNENEDDFSGRRLENSQRRSLNTFSTSSIQSSTSQMQTKQQSQPQRRRRLEILVTLPTFINDIVNVGYTSNPQLMDGIFIRGPCPYDIGNSTTDMCEEVTASIVLELTSPNNEEPLLIYGLYAAALDQGLVSGQFEDAFLQVASSDSPVVIVSGQPSQGGTISPMPTFAPTSSSSDDDNTKGLSTGAIAGISAGGFVLLILIWYVVSQQLVQERQYQEKKKRKGHGGGAAATTTAGSNDGDDYDPADVEKAIPYEMDDVSDYDNYSEKATAGSTLSETLKSHNLDTKKKNDKTTKNEEATTSTAALTGESGEEPSQSNLGQQLKAPKQKNAIEEEEKRCEDVDAWIPITEDDLPDMLAATVPYIDSSKDENVPPNQSSHKVEIVGSENIMHDRTNNTPHETRSTGNISHESEAGWSETYTSSMGTMSDDEMLPEVSTEGILEQQNVVSLGPDSPLSDTKAEQGVAAEGKYVDLESAIMAGDWAAVGATAAALASMQQESQSQSRSDVSNSTSKLSSLRSQSWKDAMDTDKAAELDQMIEQGDWEGIILAAARFEAESTGATNVYNINSQSSVDSDDRIMVHEDDSEDDDDADGTYSRSLMSAKFSTSGSADGKNDEQKISKEELRKQVAALVELVVPEEIGHVDEMMVQFAGREDELVETLQTMQARAAAQASSSKKDKKSDTKGKTIAALKSPEAAAKVRKEQGLKNK